MIIGKPNVIWQVVFVVVEILMALFLLFSFRREIMKDLFNERQQQLWSRIGIQTITFGIVLVGMVSHCYFGGCSIRNFYVSIQAAITGLLTVLGTYIAYEVNDWHKKNDDAEVLLETLAEELSDFSNRRLKETIDLVEINSKIKSGYSCTYAKLVKFDFSAYEEAKKHFGIIRSVELRKRIKGIYRGIKDVYMDLDSSDCVYTEIRRDYEKESTEGDYYAREKFNLACDALRDGLKRKLDKLNIIRNEISSLHLEIDKHCGF